MKSKRRRTVKLLGFNNGRCCCSATKNGNTWTWYDHDDPQDFGTTSTMREAEHELRNIGAIKILRCPALLDKSEPLTQELRR